MERPIPFQSDEAASLYKSFRPQYPKEVYENIINYCKHSNSSFSLALDVGCGTGLSTVPLAEYFDEVIGLDQSEAQLSKADRTKANVSYKKGKAEDLSFCTPGSVDLVIVMTAFHWLDREKFYEELQRVLKPSGVIAVCTYSLKCDLGHPEATKIVYKQFLKDVLVKENYCYNESYFLPKMFKEGFTLPFNNFERNNSILMKHKFSIDDLEGFVCSLGPYQFYKKDNPNSTVLCEIRQRLNEIFQDKEDFTFNVTWPLCLLLARK